MNWNAVQAVAELVAAFGVLASLVYLALQIREASLEAQRARYNEISGKLADIARDWSMHDSLSDLMHRGFVNPAELRPAEVFRLYSSLWGMMKAWEASFHYSLARGVHDWGAGGLRATMASFMAFPGMQHYWSNRRAWFSTEFQREVDRLMGLGAPRMDDAYGRVPPESAGDAAA